MTQCDVALLSDDGCDSGYNGAVVTFWTFLLIHSVGCAWNTFLLFPPAPLFMNVWFKDTLGDKFLDEVSIFMDFYVPNNDHIFWSELKHKKMSELSDIMQQVFICLDFHGCVVRIKFFGEWKEVPAKHSPVRGIVTENSTIESRSIDITTILPHTKTPS